MTVQPFSEKLQLPALYTPTVFLDALRSVGWEPGVVPETVIYTYARFELYLSSQRSTYTPNDMLGTGPGRFFIVNDSGGRLGINCLGTGPSATAAQIELQAALGVRNILVIGTAGGLLTDQSPGDLVLPTSAVRADGTTDHYAPRSQPALPNAELFARFAESLEDHGLSGNRSPCWTTAAPFRTTAEEVAHYASRGVRAVEEEVAALYIVGAEHGVRTAAALVLDGVPTNEGGWRLDLPTAQQQLQRLFAATVDFSAAL
jgi:uridine phosphorylase